MKYNFFSECLKRVEQITGSKIISYKIDCLDLESLRNVFKNHSIYAIVNCAALKSVGESVQKPILYYKNNIGSLLNLLIVIFFFKSSSVLLLFIFSSVWKNLMSKIFFFHPQQRSMVLHNIYHSMKNILVFVMQLPIHMGKVNLCANIFSKIQ